VSIYTFTIKMAAKELVALIETGTSLGYTGDELKQFSNDDSRMRMDREKEKEEERKRQEKEFKCAEKDHL